MKGIVVFYKPKSWTSYDVVRFLKNKLKEEKIGHGGTLDPLAEGVLIIGIKKEGTKKLSEILKNHDKEYIATIILGATSDTYDINGKIEYSTLKFLPQKEEVLKVIKNFQGEIIQRPPKFSAIKIMGIPAYKLARRGKKINLPSRKVEVREIKLLDYKIKDKLSYLKIKLKVSSGFYVRSFANDIGRELKVGGVLKELERTRVGQFSIDEAITVEDFERDNIELYFKAYGLVQGVGFRFFTQKWANILGIFGKAENLSDGGIEIIGQGKEKNLQEFLDKILTGPPSAKVESPFYYFRKPQVYYSGFEIF